MGTAFLLMKIKILDSRYYYMLYIITEFHKGEGKVKILRQLSAPTGMLIPSDLSIDRTSCKPIHYQATLTSINQSQTQQ